VDPALWELLRAEAGTDGDRVLEAVIRLARPGIEIPGVRMVARFGTIATCRIRAREVVAVRARRDVVSLKAARGISPGFEPPAGPPDPAGPALPGIRPSDVRRGAGFGLTGAGVVVAAIDWGVDFDSAAFRWPGGPGPGDGDRRAGDTRFLSFWDQRDRALGPRPEPYGYGSVHTREAIDRALRDPRPYERLGYHPAIADRNGLGAHGTRTVDIAAGNGGANGPAGIAPDADLIFVHLADRDSGGLANFGDSVRLLEAVDFISRTAGPQPCVINISAGRMCGPRDGTTLVERAFDELLATMPGRFIVDSGGNYFRWRAHSCGTLAAGETRSLTVVVNPADVTLNEVEIWYDGADELAVRIDPPGYAGSRPVRLGERADLLVAGRVAGRVYHRKRDPNNCDNHIVAYLDPIGCAGNWTVTLEARRVSSGRFHAWIERDDACRGCQARFASDDADPAVTIGSIATSHLPLVVGAYDGHDPDRPVATFSSAGPCRDGRAKPDLAAPGVGVLAARSAPIGASRNPGLLVRGNGTSFAAPHVTGAVALCFEAAGTRLRAAEIRSLVLGSCDPVLDDDPQGRRGHGYLNIPRLLADLRQALAAPTTAGAKEQTMAPEDIIVLTADPATAYREYMYRPDGRLARWITDRFDVVARPGQRIDRPPRAGDVLLEVTLGRAGQGRCSTLESGDPQLVAAPARLAPGQLLLRPLQRAEMTEPLPVEPDLGAADLAFLTSTADAAGATEREPPSGATEAGELSPDVTAGRLVVDHLPLLRSHVGTPPDLVLTWNAMKSPGTVDVVVHLHGFAARGRLMQLPADIVPVSGLDFTDPQDPSSAGRTSPTLLVLPRGNFFGGRSGRGYNFPALNPPGALSELVDDALARFGASTGTRPVQGRLILTAHSGGGASLMRILRYADPDEVHTFDALYTDPAPLIAWAQHRIARGSGAMRVLYRPGEGTAQASTAVESAIQRALGAAGPSPRWRVESTRVAHMDIPPRFGWRLLADVAADLPGSSQARVVPRRQEEEPDMVQEQESEEFEDYEALEDLEGYAGFEELEGSDELEGFRELERSDELARFDEPLATAVPVPRRHPLTTEQLRRAWADYLGAERQMAAVLLFGNQILVNPVAADAFTAFAEALRATGYHGHVLWGYDHHDAGRAGYGDPPQASLHAYGLAVDVDPQWNPHRPAVSGPVVFSARPSQRERQQEVGAGLAGTVLTPQQLAAVEAIRTVDGLQVFRWGGHWRSSHDAMHFEIRLTPAELRRGLTEQLMPGTGSECVTCGAWEADELTGEGSASEGADRGLQWGIYDELPLSWGYAEADHG
jgi:subtilisin family serine protease